MRLGEIVIGDVAGSVLFVVFSTAKGCIGYYVYVMGYCFVSPFPEQEYHCLQLLLTLMSWNQ